MRAKTIIVILFIFTIAVTPCFALSAKIAASDLSQVFVYPNPFNIGSGQTTMTFTNLAADCTIRIYNSSGELVNTINIADGDGQYAWNGTNRAGKPTVSGLYYYLIESSIDKKTGKFSIVR